MVVPYVADAQVRTIWSYDNPNTEDNVSLLERDFAGVAGAIPARELSAPSSD
jgi:hypothetical protein